MKNYGKYCIEDTVGNQNPSGPSGIGVPNVTPEVVDTTGPSDFSDEFTEQTVDPVSDTTFSNANVPGTGVIPKPTEEIDSRHCAMDLKGNIKGMMPPKITFRVTVNACLLKS